MPHGGEVWIISLAILLGFVLAAAPVFGSPLSVTVADSLSGDGISSVRLSLDGISGYTDEDGHAQLEHRPGKYRLVLQHSTYRPTQRDILLPADGLVLSVRLYPIIFEIRGMVSSAPRDTVAEGQTALARQEFQRYPSPVPDALRLAKVLPGVTSGNDLSSTYNANGGNYDQNLIYLNGVELSAPFLMRNGLAEGMSPINAEMVEGATFRSGVLPVQYGDKLSSLLDVTYSPPDSTPSRAGLVASTVRQTVVVAGYRASGVVGYTVGWRRSDLSHLTRGMQVSGDFAPKHEDVQALLRWRPSPQLELGLFGASTETRLAITPELKSLHYNCGPAPKPPRCDEFRGIPEGAEHFTHRTHLLGVRTELLGDVADLELRGSYVNSQEIESTDVAYSLSWIPRYGKAEEPTYDYLTTRETYDTRLDAERVEFQAQLVPHDDSIRWTVGAGTVHRLGDAHWHSHEGLSSGSESDSITQEADIRLDAWDMYLYGRRRWRWGRELSLNTGLRVTRQGSTGLTAFLPRLRLAWQPSRMWSLDAAIGAQAQPPLYKEKLGSALSETSGVLKAQRAYVGTAGLEQRHSLGYWRVEAYYRLLRDTISYTTDDLRLVYSGSNDARAYAYGLNCHVRGQLLKLVGSLSYAYLVAREDIEGDGLGYVRRPTDQRHTASAFLEDRMDLRSLWMGASRFHLRILYGSGFPYTPRVRPAGAGVVELVDAARNSRQGHAYFRFDIGMTQAFTVRRLEVELREEVANIFDDYNVVGYTYLPAPDGSVTELTKSLGRRMYNVELRVQL